jgi:hypothetical protein
MTQKAEFIIEGNDQSAKAAWDRQQAAIQAVIGRIGQMEDKLANAKKEQDSLIGSGINKLAGMALSYVSIQGAIGGVIDANRQMIEQADTAALKYDELFRRVNVQAATLGIAGDAGKERLLNVAIENAATVEESTSIAKALAGSGFSAEQATGSALDSVLKAQAAMGQQGEGKGGLIAEATAKYLNSMGMEMTGENMKKVLVGMQQSAKAGFGKFEDMAQLSGKVGGFSGKAKSEDVLAAFNIGLLNSSSAENAATGLKIFGDRLMGAAGDKERMGLLTKAGLQPEQVDLIGESLDQVMGTLDAAIQKMPETQRAPWMQQMFGTEASGFASNLIKNRGRMDEFRGVMANEAGFRADVAEMTSGKGAARRRQEVLDEKDYAELDTGFEDKLKSVRRRNRKAGEFDAATDLSTTVARAVRYMGASDEFALTAGFTMNPFNSNTDSVNQGLADAQALLKSANEQRELLKKIAENTGKSPVRVEKPHVPRTPVSAAAGTGGR